MYKTTKSTCSKWRTILPNSRRSAINSGQEQEPKLTTKGLPGVWKSRSFRLAGFLSSRHSTGTLIAVPPGRAFFDKSLQRTCKGVFFISELNIVCQKSSGCSPHFVQHRNFCSSFVQSGITFRSLPTAKARRSTLAKK